MSSPENWLIAFKKNSSKLILNRKSAYSTASLLTLASCGGGGGGNAGGGTPTTPAPPVGPAPGTPTEITNFVETTNNVFVANDSGGTLRFKNSQQDLTVTGGDGSDVIFTGSGNDTVSAGAGGDGVGTSPGADVLDGGDGADYLYVEDSTEGVNINFAAGTSSGGTVEGDTITNFEHAWLTGFDDIFVGDINRNIVEAGGGNDVISTGDGDDDIRGNHGADLIDGGPGIDTIAYLYSDVGVTVNLATNVNTGGHAQGDSLSNIENISGSKHDDVLTGDDNDNYIIGYEGNDIINGGGGNDEFNGFSGDDIINGGDGNDEFYGASGVDILNGDAGDDEFVLFNAGNSLTEDQFDGGTGIDTLLLFVYLENTLLDVDLSLVNAVNIEKINLSNTSNDTRLNISAQDVLDVTDAGNQLLVLGDAEDMVVSTAQGWVQGADQIIDAVTYNTYTSGAATLLIDEDITQTIS